ncbi:hypothetical protein KKB40_02995 [Patescibacteria group bacterium]|nr:hypothetical protein [Patescibacteria group bacterium]
MKQSNYVVIAVLLILVGAGSFYGGMKYQQGKQPSRADFQSRAGTRQQNLPDGAQQRMGAGAVRGEIISRDETSITVKLPDGSSKIVLISENTQINKATEASVDDLGTGEQVMVIGQTNSDGSVTAQNIQLNPELRGIPNIEP